MKFLPLLGFLWNDITHDASRSILTVLNLSAILLSFFLLAAISVGLDKAGEQNPPGNQLIVLEKQALDPMQSQMKADVIETLSTLGSGQVERVFPVIFHHLDVDNFMVQVIGAPPEEYFRTYRLKVAEGSMPQNSNEVAISEGAVHYASWNIGSILTIYGSEFRVSGIVQMPESTFATVWMSLETAERTFQNKGIYQAAMVVVPEGVNPEDVLFNIESMPALKSRYAAFLLDDIYQRFARVLEEAKTISYAMTWLSLLVITLGVYHTIHLNLEERSREIILLHVAGFTIRDLQRILLLRVGFLAVISFIAAYVAAAILIGRFDQISPIVLHGEHIPISLTPEMLAGGFALMLVFCALGVWAPTRRLSTAGVLSLHDG